MKKIVLVSLMLGATIVAQGSTLEKFNALVIETHKIFSIISMCVAKIFFKEKHANTRISKTSLLQIEM